MLSLIGLAHTQNIPVNGLMMNTDQPLPEPIMTQFPDAAYSLNELNN